MTTKPKAKKPDAAQRIWSALCNAGTQWRKANPDKGWPSEVGEQLLRELLASEYPAKSRVDGQDLIFNAIVKACGADPTCLTKPYASQVAMAKKAIVEASPDVTPIEVEIRAELLKGLFKGCSCTPLSLAKHWPELSATVQEATPTARDYSKF